MARIALICPEFRGHLNPMLTLGAGLRNRGHEVLLVGHVDAEPIASRRGIGFFRVGRDTDPGFDRGATGRIARTLGRRRGHAATIYTLRCLVGACPVHLRDLPNALRTARIDAALVDQVCIAAGTACTSVGVPFASIANALTIHRTASVPPVTMPWGPARGPGSRARNMLLHAITGAGFGLFGREVISAHRRLGLGPWTLERSFSRVLQLAQQPAWFEFPRDDLPSCFHFTGPFHLPGRDDDVAFPWHRLDGRPIVYASMGTLQNGVERVFRALADAVAGLEAQLVIALGGSDLGEDRADGTVAFAPELAGDPIVVRFAPQLALLERAAVAVTHAGLNSALEGLAAGVPMLALPVTNDQPGVAARLEHCGAARVLPASRRTPMSMRRQVAELLADEQRRAHTRELAQRIARADGVRLAIERIEQDLLGRESPASPHVVGSGR
jgi:zeaxanthin glucosyltransferase